MKKIMKIYALVAAAVMGAVACQKEIQDDAQIAGKTVAVNFVSQSPDTKTSVDTSGDIPVFSWNEAETFAVLEQTDALAQAASVEYAKVDGKAKITAEFDANPDKPSYDYVTIYPADAYVSASKIGEATLRLPAVQTMAEGSYDPAADLMVSEVVSVNAQPTETQMVRFTRVAAVVKMTLKNFTLEAGDQVEQVIFSAEGKKLAGTVTADLNKPHEFTAAGGVDNVTVNTTSATDIYFTALPTTLEAGDEYSIVVVTDKCLYAKKGTIPAEKQLVFEAGMVTRFGVNMTDAVRSNDKWELVKDATTLKEGDVVSIVAKDYDKALSTNLYSNASETSTSAKRGLADVTKYGNHFIGGEDVQQLTLVTGTVGRTFSFYDKAREKFLVSTTTGSTYLINQVYCDANTSFEITIDGSTTAATITNIEGSYVGNLLRYNSNGYFVSNQNDSPVYKDVCIYRLEGRVGTIPVVEANVTIPDEDEPVVIAEEGTAEAAAISEVVFNYVGDWTISVTSSESWFSPIYSDGKLSYTAEANTGAKREANVTIAASLKDHENLTWTFNVVQKGAPQEISIVDFAKKGKDVDAVYKLTGIIAEIPSSTYGRWKLADENGNTAQVQYLKTEDGAYVKGNVNVKVGDVISLTTVVAGTTAGLGGNNTYPSVYKGHYTLTATASGSVGYEGGSATVNVKVEKFGHVVNPPTSISVSDVKLGEKAHDDYSFTDNGDGTAVAVVNLDENKGDGSREVILNFTAGSPLAIETSVVVKQDVNPALKKGWWLVTDVNELNAGDKIIIAATGVDYAISTEANTNNRKSKLVTKNGGALKDVADNIQQYALEIDANGLYSFKGTLGTDKDKYIYATGSKNYMKVSADLENSGKWTIEIDASGAASITSQGVTTYKSMQYNNKASSAPAFYCTDGSMGDVCLYKYY